MADNDLGVVVVGLGIAGKVRVRDLQLGEYLDKVTLKGIVSRRADHGIKDTEVLTIEDALARDDVQAVIVATENSQHHDTVRAALQAGKHVLVEFPLVVDYAQLDPLYTLATEKGVVLYEENIGLLSKQHVGVKEIVQRKKAKLVKAKRSLIGSIKGGDVQTYLDRSGHPLYPAVCYLQSLMDLFGDLDPVTASMERKEDCISVTATLRAKDGGGEVVLETERKISETPMRKTTFEFTFDDGEVIDDQKVPAEMTRTTPGLFLQDLMQFVDVVRGTRDNAYQEWLTRRSQDITSQLVTMATQS